MFYEGDGFNIRYIGEWAYEDLKEWVRIRKNGQVIEENKDTQFRPNYYEKMHFCVVGRGIEYSTMKELSRRLEGPVYISQGNNEIYIYKDYDDRIVKYIGEITVSEIAKWVEYEQTPAVLPLETDYMERLFGSKDTAILLLRHRRHSWYDRELANVGTRLKGKSALVAVDVAQELGKIIQKLLKVPDKALPVVRLVQPLGGTLDITQYNMQDSITGENIIRFYDKVMSGKVKKHLASQEVPAEQYENRLRVLVGKNYSPVVNDPDKNVLVLFYSPVCSYSQEALVLFEELAYEFRWVQDLVIAKLDATNNQVDIYSFPTIKLFTKDGASPVTFLKDRTLKSLTEFIRSTIQVTQVKEDL